MRGNCPLVFVVAVTLTALPGCGPSGKAGELQRRELRAQLSMPQEAHSRPSGIRQLPPSSTTTSSSSFVSSGHGRLSSPDTLTVTDSDGRELIIMKAVRDENGEMVATDVIEAATVTARFRHLAERHGRVDLEFQVTVPSQMQDSKWQLRFYPTMVKLQDTISLEPIIITGAAYRKAQLRGYQHYQRFLDSIISDPEMMLYKGQLELFIKRNIPQLYAYRNDTTIVPEDRFLSAFGVSEREAVEHYTRGWRVKLNEYRKSRIGARYERYIKSPIVTEGIRLDTVMRSVTGDFIYNYVQPVAVRRGLRKVDILLDGEIFEQDKRVYDIPPADPLTFYISSLAQFTDHSPHYVTEIVERRVDVSTACYVEFPSGSAEVSDTLGHNPEELGRIRSNLLSLVDNNIYDLDSITVVASASPEGSWALNARLSERRAASVLDYCRAYVDHCQDSVRQQRGFFVSENGRIAQYDAPRISFSAGYVPENWDMLTSLVNADKSLSTRDRETYLQALSIEDPDMREASLRGAGCYPYLRSELYPRVRIVEFGFYLHRKGMVKDTIHTTRLDTTYMRALDAMEDRDYRTALTILRPYADFNTAVALCALDYNSSAQHILESLAPTPKTKYMLSIIYSRKGDESRAVQCYLDACAEDPALIHRGNLDPEISSLIKNYDLSSILSQNNEL